MISFFPSFKIKVFKLECVEVMILVSEITDMVGISLLGENEVRETKKVCPN